MTVWSVLLFAPTACGRIDYDTLADARAADTAVADTDTIVTTCDLDAPFARITEIPELESTSGDGGLRLSRDELTAYFHSDRDGVDYELYTASRTSVADPFGPVVRMGQLGYFPFETSDRRTLVWDDGGDIIMAQRADGTQPFDFANATPALVAVGLDIHPYVTWEMDRLYFMSNLDIVTTTWPPSAARMPITAVNVGQEHRPVVSDDGLALYFGRVNGTEEVMLSRRATTADPFGPATVVPELQYPGQPTGPTWLSPDNCRLYLESTRPLGGYGFWVAERDPQ